MKGDDSNPVKRIVRTGNYFVHFDSFKNITDAWTGWTSSWLSCLAGSSQTGGR